MLHWLYKMGKHGGRERDERERERERRERERETHQFLMTMQKQ